MLHLVGLLGRGGLIEAVNYYEQRAQPLPPALERGMERCRFASPVFMAPPWQEIFERDDERRHRFEDAIREYETLVPSYRRHGFEVILLPKVRVEERADFVLRQIPAS